MSRKLIGLALVVIGALAATALLSTGGAGLRAQAPSGETWFVEFETQEVAPVARDEVTQLVEVGTIEADGFSELVFSLGGEFKSNVPSSGRVGVILVPDEDPFIFLLETEGEYAFPLEVSVDVKGDRMFISEHRVARVAFPKYRAYLYNETNSSATCVAIYRSR